MFNPDQQRVQEWCCNPRRFVGVGTMVLLSIRQPWATVGEQLREVRLEGAKAQGLWGFKSSGYEYLQLHKDALYAKVRDVRAGRREVSSMLRHFLKVPGLGLAKAGFLAQLTTGTAGCLDSHNLERFGLQGESFRIRRRATDAAQIQEIDDKISFYLAICDACGGARLLWDEWCHYVYHRRTQFRSAEDVSRRHYTYLLENWQ